MKYKVGDKVKISVYLNAGDERDGGCYITPGMEAKRGMTATIVETAVVPGGLHERYLVDIDRHWYSETMLIGDADTDTAVESEPHKDIPSPYERITDLIECLAFVRATMLHEGISKEEIDMHIRDEAIRLFDKMENMSHEEMVLYSLRKVLEIGKDLK